MTRPRLLAVAGRGAWPVAARVTRTSGRPWTHETKQNGVRRRSTRLPPTNKTKHSGLYPRRNLSWRRGGLAGIVAGPAAGLRCDFRNPPLKRCFAVRAPIPRPAPTTAARRTRWTSQSTGSRARTCVMFVNAAITSTGAARVPRRRRRAAAVAGLPARVRARQLPRPVRRDAGAGHQRPQRRADRAATCCATAATPPPAQRRSRARLIARAAARCCRRSGSTGCSASCAGRGQQPAHPGDHARLGGGPPRPGVRRGQVPPGAEGRAPRHAHLRAARRARHVPVRLAPPDAVRHADPGGVAAGALRAARRCTSCRTRSPRGSPPSTASTGRRSSSGIAPRLTRLERLRLQASAQRRGVDAVAVDLAAMPLTRLRVYVLSLPRPERAAAPRRADRRAAGGRPPRRAAGRPARGAGSRRCWTTASPPSAPG